MKFKSAKMKINPLNKRLCAFLFAVVFAFASVVYPLKPVRVSADAGEIAGIADFVDMAFNFSSGGVPAGWSVNGYAAYIAALWAVHTALNNPIHAGGDWDASSITAIEGKYNYNGELYPCVSSSVGNSFSPADGGVNCCRSPHFNVYVLCAGADRLNVGYSVGGSYISLRWIYYGSVSSVSIYANSSIISDYSTTNLTNNTINAEFTTDSAYPRIQDGETVWRYFTFNSPAAIAKLGSSFQLPSGSLSSGNVNSYINDVLNPYFITQYPDIEPYVYTPYVPIYPTDFVTGIPKNWTVENPQLPTATDLEFEHYEDDLTGFHPIQEIKETVDIIKAMDFWWWLTENTLDVLNLKIFYVIFLTVGVLIFIVWIIGQ